MQHNPLDPPSPCTSVCEINFDRNVCSGCLRTLEEIARWSAMSPAQKCEVIRRVEAQRATGDQSPIS